ncbi:hypothetical protein DAPPUDRAFT_233983 [Daphnia pulex]|uniref:Uncharacterized protein n=1 Tax=Daphnia pulex TaxID=6669 RepID=E9FWA1_DAPPU|nr:hypothetical protein DAPPUDRAFT_233983 [Daphnia pulex]|eukprot:EFX88689.1 hypothetical protein DAPPUDRAFT_233983 [Daphnia pulex]
MARCRPFGIATHGRSSAIGRDDAQELMPLGPLHHLPVNKDKRFGQQMLGDDWDFYYCIRQSPL